MKRPFNKKDKSKKSLKNDDSFNLLDISETDVEPIYKPVPHHVLTPDEVIAGFSQDKSSDVRKTGALDSLKKRIIFSAEQNDTQISQEENAPQGFSVTIPQKPKSNETIIKQEEESSAVFEDIIPVIRKQDTKTVIEPKAGEEAIPPTPSVLDNKEKDLPHSAEPITDEKETPSLLDKCVEYIKDDEGNTADLNSEPLYKLQSVAEILQSESDENLKRLSEKYNISFDDLGRVPSPPVFEIPKDTTLVPDESVPEESSNNENTKFEINWDDSQEEVVVEDEEEKITFVSVQSNVKSVISDIDAPYVNTSADTPKNINDTATITFTPISSSSDGQTFLKVSSQTRPIDLTGEISELPDMEPEAKDVQLEKDEFEDYFPEEELDCQKNSGKFLKKFSIQRRNYFLTTTFSIFFTIILSITKLPFMSQLILSNTRTTMIVFSSIAALIVLINFDMFASFKNILRKRSGPDVCASLASLTTLGYAVFGIISEIIISDILLLLGIILSFRSLTAYFKSSYMLSNLKLIGGKFKKKAVKLIDDSAITFAMSKNAIEGDVLIASPQTTTHISNFMKYSTFGLFLGGKLPLLTIVSVLLSVILGFTCSFYYDGIVHGLYAASAVQCFTALPVAFFIDVLPLYRANKKLKSKGGMIAGKTAAEHLEMANAVVVDAADLFPKGKITLHQMKILSENNLEDTLIRAASLTESLGSSLAPIFKEIAGTGNIDVLPDSDTVKYEDRMGISGWVDNRLLFIGNRTLMEAHSISVPPIEVDRKILRKGYFPVYVATREKACALLIIQYHVDAEIARDIRQLTSSGVTLLVNSCDPNLIEEMICDYFGLYNDSVKVMSAAGIHMYKNVMSETVSASAPALYKNNPLALVSILNCASKIKKSNLLLNVLYIIFTVLGAVLFAYSSLTGADSLIAETTLLLYGVLSTVISYIIYFFARP